MSCQAPVQPAGRAVGGLLKSGQIWKNRAVTMIHSPFLSLLQFLHEEDVS
jgi:hypothetical protein